MNDPTFNRLYPDIDPTVPLPPTFFERIGITVAAAVFSFGAAAGHLVIAGVGFALFMFALIANTMKVPRKVRNEARIRFPQQTWAETELNRELRVDILVPLLWLVTLMLCALVFFFSPIRWYPIPELGCATITAVIVWFLPGMSPLWSRLRPSRRHNNSVPTGHSDTQPHTN